MAGITLEMAREHLDAWLRAELAVSQSQSYTLVGHRSVTKADLGEIRQQIQFWSNRVAALENAEKGGGRRIYRGILKDF